MTLQELLAQIVGPGAPEPPRSIVRRREPMPTAPQRYAGQRGALQRDPIPAWASDPGMVERVQQRGAFDRANRAPEPPSYPIGPGAVGGALALDPAPLPRYPVGPGGLPDDLPAPLPAQPPAPRAPIGALTGDRPALGNAADWIVPQRPLPRGPFARRDPVDAEPWRAPEPAVGIPVGGAAPRRGMEPPNAPVAPTQDDDLDAAWNAALERVRSGRVHVPAQRIRLSKG